jgi:hypothetical protein
VFGFMDKLMVRHEHDLFTIGLLNLMVETRIAHQIEHNPTRSVCGRTLLAQSSPLYIHV